MTEPTGMNLALLLMTAAFMENETMDKTDIYHPEVVEAFAAAWASIDGKLEKFEAEKNAPYDTPQDALDGHYDGYMYEAAELLKRAGERIQSFDLFTRLDPSP